MTKEFAPAYCPKCGDEKGWKSIGVVTSKGKPSKPHGFWYSLLEHMGLLGLLGIIATDAVRGTDQILYHCDKCGYEDRYDPD